MRLRGHWVSRLAVVLLLSWTAIDLGVASVCASDTGGAAASAGGAATYTVAATPSQNAVPTDDCFCCCHTAQPAVTIELFVSQSVAAPFVIPPVAVRSLAHVPVDQPPQA